ncbi:aminoacyl-tRNA deacylase [Colwellia piezophila]|uniref:aminoacyl-tRNA deacylase n=1 Tax=Colwellia piezophila TaxID=211668 RepID=UPI0004764D7B|nr:YbaK/EbsC family protein [Colwellia piezophila]
MNTSTRLTRYLTEKSMPFKLLPHFHSNSSVGSAITANISLKQLAKAVLLINHDDKKLMAILPAANKINLSALNDSLHGVYRLMTEKEVYQQFSDCSHGAIPPAPDSYHLNMVFEQVLEQLSEVYLESGDHETLICISQASFKALMTQGKHLNFSREVFH